jgi:hypothetical protein
MNVIERIKLGTKWEQFASRRGRISPGEISPDLTEQESWLDLGSGLDTLKNKRVLSLPEIQLHVPGCVSRSSLVSYINSLLNYWN